MFTMSPSMSFSMWSLIIYYLHEFSDFVNHKLDFVMTAKSQLQDILVIAPIVISSSEIKNESNTNQSGSNIEFFQWKLRKNLETLDFLAELELRYDIHKVLPRFLDDCFEVKKEVQQTTIELTRTLASYKNCISNKISLFENNI